MTEITDNPLHPTGLGSWRHLRGPSYTAVDNNFMFNADRSFAGTIVVSRDIELSTNSNEYTATATSQIFDAGDQLMSTGCATSTGTRLE